MTLENPTVESFIIPAANGLDQINVFVTVYGPHSCRLTVACYDTAWSTCFMHMDMPWREFVAGAQAAYLAVKLHALKKRHEAWLLRICEAIKAFIKEGAK